MSGASGCLGGLILAVPVTQNENHNIAMSGLNFLRITAIAGITTVVTCHRMDM